MKNKSVKEIIDSCGGTGHLSEVTGLTESMIYKWRRRGIPEKYWDHLDGFDANEIHAANKHAREVYGKKNEKDKVI